MGLFQTCPRADLQSWGSFRNTQLRFSRLRSRLRVCKAQGPNYHSHNVISLELIPHSADGWETSVVCPPGGDGDHGRYDFMRFVETGTVMPLRKRDPAIPSGDRTGSVRDPVVWFPQIGSMSRRGGCQPGVALSAVDDVHEQRWSETLYVILARQRLSRLLVAISLWRRRLLRKAVGVGGRFR